MRISRLYILQPPEIRVIGLYLSLINLYLMQSNTNLNELKHLDPVLYGLEIYHLSNNLAKYLIGDDVARLDFKFYCVPYRDDFIGENFLKLW